MEDLRYSSEQEHFAAAARAAFRLCKGRDPAAIAARLGEDGILGMMGDESVAGLGAGIGMALPVVEAAGAEMLPFPLVESLVTVAALQGLLGDLARRLARGESIATVAWVGCLRARRAAGGWQLAGGLAHVPMLQSVQWLVAPVAIDDIDHRGETATAVIDVASASLRFDDEPGFDLERPRPGVVVEADIPAAHLLRGSADPWPLVRRRGGILHVADMLGAAQAAMEATVEYVRTRRQFGRPLAAFQAVRHRLARDHVALTNTRRSMAYAAATEDASAPDREMARWAMGALAADTCRQAAESSMHLHGAMGFTFDMPLHRFVRRIRSLAVCASGHDARAALADLLMS